MLSSVRFGPTDVHFITFLFFRTDYFLDNFGGTEIDVVSTLSLLLTFHDTAHSHEQ
jgi:hypothetical protein